MRELWLSTTLNTSNKKASTLLGVGAFAFLCIKPPKFGNNVITFKVQKGVFILINKVEISNVNTSKLKVLTNAENKELFIKMKEGDETAREKIISRKFKISIKRNSKIWRASEKILMIYFK